MHNRDEAAIRARAYQLWVESGYADGYQDQHWRQAEREIAERNAAGDGSAASGGTADRAAPDDRPRNPDRIHSDGMSSHPSVIDLPPGRERA